MPTIYPRSESGLVDHGDTTTAGRVVNSSNFGLLGDPDFVTIHHSAGPRAPDKRTAQRLHAQYQRLHMAEFGGDIGYHFSIDDLGRVYRLRPYKYKGAHVGGHNTQNVGIMVHGNYMFHKLTDDQNDTLRWLFRGGFVELFDEPEAGIHAVRTHREWSGHSTNLCPGENLQRHMNYLRATETY